MNRRWLKTHIEDDVENRLEDNDVAVARSLRKLLLLLHMLFFVVDVLIVLLRHPAYVRGATSKHIQQGVFVCVLVVVRYIGGHKKRSAVF